MPRSPDPLVRAYAACEALARSHYENFPVASWLLPEQMRPHVAAVYAYARVADDMADEGHDPPEVRRRRLEGWQEALHRTVAGSTPEAPLDERDRLILLALGHSIRSLDLPVGLFDDLLSAFGQDTMASRYGTWADLFDYCRRSANPVGRLVLRIAGYRADALDRSSDAFCTALQLTNFWQDIGRDWRAGRLYVPGDVADACGAAERTLDDGALDAAWLRVIGQCIGVTRALFEDGRAVCDGVRGRLRWELRFTWLGGRRILDRVERAGAHVIDRRPTLGPRDVPALVWHGLSWPSRVTDGA